MICDSPAFSFGIVGAGWRTDFFLRIAAAVDGIDASGVVVRDSARASEVESSWNVRAFADVGSMLGATRPSFVVASVSDSAMAEVTLDLARRGLPVLAETPPAIDLQGLLDLNEEIIRLGSQVQVAEQYWAQPLHSARLALTRDNLLGPINQAHISVCHDYHAVSLVRRFLAAGFDSPRVSAKRFVSRVIAGPDRSGPPRRENFVETEMKQYWLDFGDRLGVIEFSLPQYRSWIRGQKVCIRGERGEILDQQVTYLQDHLTPIRGSLVRHQAGTDGNLEGHHLKGIQFLDRWVYSNPVAPARLSDEEIAVATCLLRMDRYVRTGESFYSLAEASQDQYLALLCSQALASGTEVRATPQAWAE